MKQTSKSLEGQFVPATIYHKLLQSIKIYFMLFIYFYRMFFINAGYNTSPSLFSRGEQLASPLGVCRIGQSKRQTTGF